MNKKRSADELENKQEEYECSICLEKHPKFKMFQNTRICKCPNLQFCYSCVFLLESEKCPTCRGSLYQEKNYVVFGPSDLQLSDDELGKKVKMWISDQDHSYTQKRNVIVWELLRKINDRMEEIKKMPDKEKFNHYIQADVQITTKGIDNIKLRSVREIIQHLCLVSDIYCVSFKFASELDKEYYIENSEEWFKSISKIIITTHWTTTKGFNFEKFKPLVFEYDH